MPHRVVFHCARPPLDFPGHLATVTNCSRVLGFFGGVLTVVTCFFLGGFGGGVGCGFPVPCLGGGLPTLETGPVVFGPYCPCTVIDVGDGCRVISPVAADPPPPVLVPPAPVED